jgi:hypothetical protein
MKVLKKEKRMMEVDVTIENYFLCDKCNQKIEHENYNAFECNFIHKTGSNYPSGGSGEKKEMDLCEECAVELVTLLRTNGYRVNDSEWDW